VDLLREWEGSGGGGVGRGWGGVGVGVDRSEWLISFCWASKVVVRVGVVSTGEFDPGTMPLSFSKKGNRMPKAEAGVPDGTGVLSLSTGVWLDVDGFGTDVSILGGVGILPGIFSALGSEGGN
jgi:hypothetical protein